MWRILLLISDGTPLEEIQCHHRVGTLLVLLTRELFLSNRGALLDDLEAAESHKFSALLTTSRIKRAHSWRRSKCLWLLFVLELGHLSE